MKPQTHMELDRGKFFSCAKIFLSIYAILAWAFPVWLVASPADEKWISVVNEEGQELKIQPLSLLHTEEDDTWVCFRLPQSQRWYLYPLDKLTPASRVSVVSAGEKGYLLVADNITGEDLDFLEEYLRAEPRERLRLRQVELIRRKRELSRQTDQIREQTNRLQMQVAQTTDPVLRQRLMDVFQRSLRDRDRYSRQLGLVQAELDRLRRNEDRLQRLVLEKQFERVD